MIYDSKYHDIYNLTILKDYVKNVYYTNKCIKELYNKMV